MAKFSKGKVGRLLGVTPIAETSDAQIWTHLVTPQVKALLGPIQSIDEPKLLESNDPVYLGDPATNLNDHRLYGGKDGFVRFPYLVTYVRTAYGALIIKRDGLKFKAIGLHGDVAKGTAELIYKVALRDRRFDGTPRTNDSAILDFPYDDPRHNRPLHKELSGVEVSIYGFLPGTRIAQSPADKEFENFIANPFTFLDRPDLFLALFKRAWDSNRAPGQIAAPIPDVARLIAPKFELIARKKGYDLLEDAASHYHVAMFARSAGFRVSYEDQLKELVALSQGIQKLKDNGLKLTRPQESWVCVMQSLPVDLIPAQFYMGGAKWVQDNISQRNLWMNKPLSEKSLHLVPGQIVRNAVA